MAILIAISVTAVSSVPTFVSGPAPSKADILSSPSSGNSICCGPGEDYELAWTWQGEVPSNLTAAWISYYTNSTFQSFKTKFGWNVIRLGFKFSANDTSSAEQFLNVSNFANLDLAIHMANTYGFKVILDDIENSQFGFYGSPTWYYDWNMTTQHYKGDTGIAFFEVANEMGKNNTGTNNNDCGTIGTSAITCLDLITSQIHSIDPNRVVAWWAYSLPNPSVFPSNESNLIIDVHAGDYLNSTTCSTVAGFQRGVNSFLSSQKSSGIQVVYGELNMQAKNCESIGSSDIQYLIQNNVPWIAWGFKASYAEWVPILNYVNVTSSTTTTSSDTRALTSNSSSVSSSTSTSSSSSASTFSTKTTTSKSSSLQTNTVPKASSSFLGMSPKQTTAATYGSSVSLLVLVLGGIVIASWARRRPGAEPASNWKW